MVTSIEFVRIIVNATFAARRFFICLTNTGMNSSHRIRVYLEQHKVGPLFEDLMSKLISEMPSEPVPFLIQILQKKIYHVPQTVMNVPQLRRSLGNLTSTLEIEKLPIQRKQSSSVIKRNSRPVTPSVMIAPKKAVTICYPIRTVTSKPMKAVTTGALKSGENRRSPTPERFVPKESKPSFDYNSIDSNFPRWRPGGYNGPVIPGSVFMEDPFKDEIINIHQFDNVPKFNFSQPEYSKKIIDEHNICSDRSHSTFKTNKQFTQESSYDSIDGNNEHCYVEVTEEDASNDDNGQWNFNICSVCAKVMDNQDSAKKMPACPSEPQNQSKADIPLLEIPKETNKAKDDLFASIRSLPLPPSPKNTIYQSKGKNWYESTLESLYASSNSWKI